MKGENRLSLKQAINATSTILLFLVGTSIWINTPFAEYTFRAAIELENIWWSDNLIAGTLGYLGAGIIAAILYSPVAIVAIGLPKLVRKLIKRWAK